MLVAHSLPCAKICCAAALLPSTWLRLVIPKPRMNILIVDDVEMNRKLLNALLDAEGMKVFSARDGVEALNILEREKIEAVISDILMPRMDGYRLCVEIRKSEKL